MAEPTSGSSELLTRLGVGVVVVVVALLLFQFVLGWIFSLIRIALVVALLAVVAWLVLVGPPGTDE
jgi:hypothetical protein